MNARAEPPTLFAHVGALLDDWCAALELQARRAGIAEAYAALCRESLMLPAGRRPLQGSSLNADGTPFQLAVTLGSGRPALQFLAEGARPGLHGPARLDGAGRAMARLAAALACERALDEVRPWLAALAPPQDSDASACEAGALWLGAAFAASGRVRMKIYVNARFGPPPARRARMDALAARFGQGGAWRAAVATMPGAEPLGAAILIGPDAPPSARLYAVSQGPGLAGAPAFAEQVGGAMFREQVEQAARHLFGATPSSATRALVASVALDGPSLVDPKVEFCAPWIFDSDLDAGTRCRHWLEGLDIDPALYERALALCAGGSPDGSRCAAHAYVGIGSSGGRATASLYLNPAAGAVRRRAA